MEGEKIRNREMKFKDYNQHQIFLLPNSIEDLIPIDHEVRGFDAIIEELDLSKLYSSYSEEGQPGYHAKMLLKILLYGYSNKIGSSRKIAEAVKTDICYMYLAGMQRPDFRTISDFRKNKLKLIAEYYLQVLRMCQKIGMIKLGHISIDGSKIEARASRKRTKTRDELLRLEEQIESILKAAEEEDKKEDAQMDKADSNKKLPKELRNKKELLEKIKEAKKHLEGNNLEKVNITDPESRSMKTADQGYDICYNAQIAVDSEKQIIIANDVVSKESDNGLFIPMYQALQNNLEEKPKKTSADAGYYSGINYLYIEQNEIDAYIPDSRFSVETDKEGNEIIGQYDRRKFNYNKKRDKYICPMGKELKFRRNNSRNGINFKIYRCNDCPGCKKRSECISKEGKYREIQIYENDKFKAEMRKKLLSEEGRKIYNKRNVIVEPVFAHIKRSIGIRQFLLRGLEKVRSEFNLICTVYNIKKLIRYASA